MCKREARRLFLLGLLADGEREASLLVAARLALGALSRAVRWTRWARAGGGQRARALLL